MANKPDSDRVTEVIDCWKWEEEYKADFVLPVNNKLMHDNQLLIMVIKGPNDRADFHVQRGEEMFMQLRGDMRLKFVEHGKHREVPIEKGQIMLVPASVPHSPRRLAGSLGFVASRLRDPDTEFDCIRWYVEGKDGNLTTDILYEDWIYSDEVDIQPVPQINKFHKSEQYRTGKPIPGIIPTKPPFEDNTEIDFPEKVDFEEFIKKHREEIDTVGRKSIFDDKFQARVYVHGKGKFTGDSDETEIWILQWGGSTVVDVEGQGETHLKKKEESLMVPRYRRYTIKQEAGSIALAFSMSPHRSTTWSKGRLMPAVE